MFARVWGSGKTADHFCLAELQILTVFLITTRQCRYCPYILCDVTMSFAVKTENSCKHIVKEKVYKLTPNPNQPKIQLSHQIGRGPCREKLKMSNTYFCNSALILCSTRNIYKHSRRVAMLCVSPKVLF